MTAEELALSLGAEVEMDPDELALTLGGEAEAYDTGQSQFATILSSGLRGAASVPKAIVGGTGAAASLVPGLEDNALQRAAKTMGEFTESNIPVNPRFAETFPTKAGGVMGQAAGQLGTALVAAPLRLGTAGMQAIGLGTAGLMGAEQGAEQAERFGVTDRGGRAAMILGGAATEAGTEAIGGFGGRNFSSLLANQVADYTKRGVKQAVKDVAAEAGEEVVAGQAQDFLTQAVVEEDEANPGFSVNGQPLPPAFFTLENLKNRLEEGALGAVGGGVFGGSRLLLENKGSRQGMQLRSNVQSRIQELESMPERTEQDELELQGLMEQDSVLESELSNQGIAPEEQRSILSQSNPPPSPLLTPEEQEAFADADEQRAVADEAEPIAPLAAEALRELAVETENEVLMPEEVEGDVSLTEEAIAETQEPVAEQPSEATTASIPIMVTQDMTQQLLDMGYTSQEVNAMRPEQAQAAISAGGRPSQTNVQGTIIDQGTGGAVVADARSAGLNQPSSPEGAVDINPASSANLADVGNTIPILEEIDSQFQIPPNSPLGTTSLYRSNNASQFFKFLEDRGGVKAETFSKIRAAFPGLVNGFDSLPRQTQGVVLGMMLRGIGNDKILNSIVKFIPVEVMDLLGSKKLSPDVILDNASVIGHYLSSARDLPVSRFIVGIINSKIANLPLFGTGSRAEFSGPASLNRGSKFGVAEGADKGSGVTHTAEYTPSRRLIQEPSFPAPVGAQPSGGQTVAPQVQAVTPSTIPFGDPDPVGRLASQIQAAEQAEVNPESKAKLTAFSQQLPAVLDRYRNLFSGVMFTRLPSGGGVNAGELTDSLRIDPQRVLDTIQTAPTTEDSVAAFETMLDEEFRHRVSLELDRTSPDFKRDLQALWDNLPDEIKTASAELYFKQTGAQYESDWQAKHEFFRQYWQDADFRALTETSLKEGGKYEFLQRLIDSFLKALKSLREGADANVKPILDRLIAQAQQRANEIRAQATQTQPTDATTQVQQQESLPAERESGDQGREAAQTGGSNRVLSEEGGQEEVTSLKRAVTDAERVSRGAPAIPTPSTRGWSVAEQEAQAELKKNPRAGFELIDRLKANPHALSDTENALLLFHKVQVVNDIKNASKAVSEAKTDEEVAEAMAVYDRALEAQNDVDVYSRLAGTESGRSLNARKMEQKLAKEDISLPALLQKYRTEANLGEKLSADDKAVVEKNAQLLKKAQEAVESAEKAEVEQQAKPVERKIALEARAEEKEAREGIKQARKKTFKDLGQSARERLKERKEKGLSAPTVGSGPLDAEYMAAVETGDMSKAQKMVDEAIRMAGLDSIKPTKGRPKSKKEFMAAIEAMGGTVDDDGYTFNADAPSGYIWNTNGGTSYAIPYSNNSGSWFSKVMAEEWKSIEDGLSLVLDPADKKQFRYDLGDDEWGEISDPVVLDYDGKVVPLSKRFPQSGRSLSAPEASKAEQDFEDYAIVGAEYIEDGAKSLESFTEKMTGEFGSSIQDQIEPLYNRAREIHAEAVATLQKEQAKAKEAAKPSSVLEAGKKILEGKPKDKIDRELAVKLFKAHVRARPSLTPEQVNSAVTENLKEIYPNITESDVRVAITNYGKAKWPSKDALKQREAEYRRILRLIESLERIQGGQQALKSGLQRSKPSPRERELTAQIKEAMKKFKVETTAENQLATTKKAITNRLKNQIEDLNRIIEGKGKPKTPREQVKYDAEMNALVKERNELQEYVDDLTGPSPEGKWNQKARAAAKASAEYYRRKIEQKDFAARSKPGYQPDETTRKLQDEAKAAKAEFENLKDLSGETQKEQLAAQKKRLESEIEKVKERLITGKKPPAGKPKATDAEIQSLKETLKNLRESVRLVEGTSRQSDAKKAEAARKMLERSIDRMEKEIVRREQDNKTLPKEKKEQPDSPELRALRERRDVLRETIDALKEAESPRRLPEEIALDNFKSRVDKLRYDAEKGIERNQYLELPPESQLKEVRDRQKAARFQLEEAKKAWNTELLDKKLSKRSTIKKIFGTAQEVLNLSRAILTSFDLSAPLRQGAFITFANPTLAAKALGPMLKSFASAEAQSNAMEEIRNRKNFPLYKQAGLFLSDINEADLSKMEEAYMSRWVDKIPRALGGGLVRGSQRAYTTFLNKLRAGSFDAMVATLGRDGKVTREEGKQLANFINVATGRGVIGSSAKPQGNSALATVFFSPRLVASRFNLLFGQPLYGGNARTRALVAKEYAKFLFGVGVALGLVSLMRDEDDEEPVISTDPRSSDFLKVRLGNTRVDLFGGILQATVLLSRLISGETTNLGGETSAIRGEDKEFNAPGAGDILWRFTRSKFSPAIGSIVNLLEGEDFMGKPTDLKSEAQKMVVPMSYGSIKDVFEEQGIAKGTMLSLLSLFGAGVNTYKPKED